MSTLPPSVALIETMRLWRGRFRFADRHAARLEASAAALGVRFDPVRWRSVLREAAARGPCGGALVRVALGADGRMGWTARPLVPLAVPVRVAVVHLDKSVPLLPHKTSERRVYDEALAKAQASGAADALLVNPSGLVVETTRMNVFYRLGGRWYTPPASDGLLPGILRGVLLARGRVTERSLPLEALTRVEQLCIGNSARGLIPVQRRGA